MFHYIQCWHEDTRPPVNHQNDLYYTYTLPSHAWELFAYVNCCWSWLAPAHDHPGNVCWEQWRFNYDKEKCQRIDKLEDRESQTGNERERDICLLWQGELWPAGGWRLKIPHPEPVMIWGDLGINLSAFRSALVCLSNRVGGEMAGGR